MLVLPADRVYMIRRKDIRTPQFFLYDVVELTLSTAIWTPRADDAREFYTEESVETFLYERLRGRPAEIIMVK